MNKKLVALMALVLVIVIAVVWFLVVDTGDDEDDGGSADEIKLAQTFTDEATGITVEYPDGWAAKADDSGMGVVVANSQEALDADSLGEGQLGVVVMAFPLETLGVTELGAAFEQFKTMMTGGDDANAGEITDIKVGDMDAKRMTLSNGEKGDGLMIGWIADGNLVVAMGSTPVGKIADVEPYVLKMAESVKVAAK